MISADIGLVQNANLVQRLQRRNFVRLSECPQYNTPERHLRHSRSQYVANDRGSGDQVKGLEHHADAPAELPQGFSFQTAYVDPIDRQCAACDLMHSVHGTQQRRFTRAGTANDGDEFPILYGQVHIIQAHSAIGIDFGYMVEYDHCFFLAS